MKSRLDSHRLLLWVEEERDIEELKAISVIRVAIADTIV